MKRFLTLFFITLLTLNATTKQNLPDDEILKKQIGRMLLVGFDDLHVDEDSKIVQDINKYNLGGVILFDIFYNDRSKNKNILSPKQLQILTSNLQKLSNKPLLISVDQEGGKVARLKPKYGFFEIPSAKEVSTLHVEYAQQIYYNQAKMLSTHGINCDFAPVVDLAVNKKNKVIYGLNRSYGSDAKVVSKYAKILIDELKKENVLSVLKHFPGHGSSLGDSHKGFVDVTDTWSEKELEPYKILIASNSVDMIMTAHVFNKNLDKKYPATLSYEVNTKLLRQKMGYDGVIISDDLQMGAIREHYSLQEIVVLSINSGVDILLFGNQLADQDIDELVLTILKQVKNGSIPYERILESNKRLEKIYE